MRPAQSSSSRSIPLLSLRRAFSGESDGSSSPSGRSSCFGGGKDCETRRAAARPSHTAMTITTSRAMSSRKRVMAQGYVRLCQGFKLHFLFHAGKFARWCVLVDNARPPELRRKQDGVSLLCQRGPNRIARQIMKNFS